MTSPCQRQQLFISYSRKDRPWVDRIRTMLAPLVRSADLTLWDDSEIPAGAKWEEGIEQALATAKVALLLVSADFLASDFVHRKELPPILKAAEDEGLRILWVKLRPCLVQRTRIHAYQAVINPSQPLAAMAETEQEEALVKIAEEIDGIFQQARQQQHEQNLSRYRQEFSAAMQVQSPLEAAVRAELHSLQQTFNLSDADVEEIETQLHAQKQEERRQRERQAAAERARVEAEQRALQEAQRFRQGLNTVPASHGWLVQDGGSWRVKTEPLPLQGYREELAPGQEITMLRLPAGSFQMGSPASEAGRDADEGPEHPVDLGEFFLAQTPITQAQWRVVASWPPQQGKLEHDPARFKGDQRPVESVSWHEAMEFCRRLSAQTGKSYGLPSEAQWEYACRAGTTTPFSYGATISTELANYDGNFSYAKGPTGESRGYTTDVGSFPANAWGLQDMHGNVWEWCADHWHGSYEGAPNDGRPWVEAEASDETSRLLRCGSWSDNPGLCRSAYRLSIHPGDRLNHFGFRVACLPPGFPS